jgi:hypothetical protein
VGFRVRSDADPVLSGRFVIQDFLDTSECAETVRRIIHLRNHWTRRSGGYFTLGAASYFDATESHDRYVTAAAQTNSLLSSAFRDLYSGLLGFLESVLDEPVGYGEHLALPGFHVFEFSGKPSEASQPDSQEHESADDSPAKRVHFDLQFRQAVPDWTPESTVSFTLPLEQPVGGAGLAVWPLDCAEVVRRNMSAADLVDYAAHNDYERISYETGRMILHDGLLLHSLLHAFAAPGAPMSKGRRITLQGHGVRRNGRWTLFW